MISTERLEIIRSSELAFVQDANISPRVRQLAEEMADALGELLEYRRMGPIHREPPQNIKLLGEVQ